MGDILFIDRCQKFIEEVDGTYPLLFAYLFGSRAKGTHNVMSDIDIAIMFAKDYDDAYDLFNRGDIIEAGIEFFKGPIDVINLAKVPLIQQYEVVQHGIVLAGKDCFERLEFESIVLRKYFDFRYYSEQYNRVAISRIREGSYFGGDTTG